jgi:hypothetical protein
MKKNESSALPKRPLRAISAMPVRGPIVYKAADVTEERSEEMKRAFAEHPFEETSMVKSQRSGSFYGAGMFRAKGVSMSNPSFSLKGLVRSSPPSPPKGQDKDKEGAEGLASAKELDILKAHEHDKVIDLNPTQEMVVNMAPDSMEIPLWFSLMRSGLTFNDGDVEFSPPCVGIIVDTPGMEGVAGFPTSINSEMFLACPIMKTRQCMMDLPNMYKIKSNPSEKLLAYAEFVCSPLISVDFMSLCPDPPMLAPQSIAEVSCAGVVQFEGSDVVKALDYYAELHPEMKAVRDIWVAMNGNNVLKRSNCVMRVPKSFWAGDTIAHIVGRVCIYTRVPVSVSNGDHMATPGYSVALGTQWAVSV